MKINKLFYNLNINLHNEVVYTQYTGIIFKERIKRYKKKVIVNINY